MATTEAAPKGSEPTKKEDSGLASTPTPPLAADEPAVTNPPEAATESKEEKKEQPPAQAGATEAPMERALPLRESSFAAPPAASPSPR